jgi:uncharacterized protein YjaG (DUF416 family)
VVVVEIGVVGSLDVPAVDMVSSVVALVENVVTSDVLEIVVEISTLPRVPVAVASQLFAVLPMAHAGPVIQVSGLGG